VNINSKNGPTQTGAIKATAVSQPVQLGSTTVRIPITNGFGSPVVVNNASQATARQKAQPTGLNQTKTVRITPAQTGATRVRANIAQSINDFLSQ
jgi:hypothetical protein